MIVGLRVASGVLALVWAVLLFAIIDLLTALTWRAGWEETLALEASWGALFTFFMVVPLLVVMVRPVRYVEAGLWSVVVAASLLAGSIIATDATVVWLAVAASSPVRSSWASGWRRPGGRAFHGRRARGFGHPGCSPRSRRPGSRSGASTSRTPSARTRGFRRR